MNEAVENCAQLLLETIPLVMRSIRSEVRRHRFPEFSLVQFRAMAFIGRHRGANLSGVAEHLGLTLPAASRLVDGLVCAKFVTRGHDSKDRRKVWLDLTPAGGKRYSVARDAARQLLGSRIASLPAGEMALLATSLTRLASLFEPGEPRPDPAPKPRTPALSARRQSPDEKL